jgi:hypothetical protein
MQIRVIWDHGTVWILRRKRSGVECIAQAQAEDAAGLLACLKLHDRQIVGSRLSILMDHPRLDHRLERIPDLAKKVRIQLLGQRHEKTYSKELRYWAAQKLDLAVEAQQARYLVASVPAELNDRIADWALRAGVYLEGIFSLPATIAKSAPKDGVLQPRIRAVQFASVTYLIASDTAANPLFFSRIGEAGVDFSRTIRASERLALFVEQEFGIELVTDASALAESEELTAECLFKASPKEMLNICAPHERRQQTSLRVRLRACAALLCGLLLVALWVQPRMAEKRRLDAERTSLAPEIRTSQMELAAIEADLAEQKVMKQFIAFSRDRSGGANPGAAPSPVLTLFAAVSNALPANLELDRFECRINPENESLEVSLRGRPLSPDLNLSAQLKPFRDQLEGQGWLILSVSIDFVQTNSPTRSRFSRRGAERFFEGRIVVGAKPLNLDDL